MPVVIVAPVWKPRLNSSLLEQSLHLAPAGKSSLLGGSVDAGNPSIMHGEETLRLTIFMRAVRHGFELATRPGDAS